MEALGAEHANVVRRGSTLEITIYRKDDWTGTMKVKR